MAISEINLRLAEPIDGEGIAKIFRTSRQYFLPYLPQLHSFEEDVAYYSDVVLKESNVWCAEQNGILIGFCAFRDGWLDHLYCLPTHVGNGLGSRFLGKAKDRQAHLNLWVFQQNTNAILFYQKHGFTKIKETDGSNCEEKVPDALYRWESERG